MRVRCIFYIAVLSLSAVISTTLNAGESTNSPPELDEPNPFEINEIVATPYLPPEGFFAPEAATQDKLPRHIEQALEFLENRPDAPEAPRAAFDAMLTATMMANQQIADKMRVRLLMDYPSTFQARAALSLIPDAPTLRNLITKELERVELRWTPQLSRRYLRAVDLGFKRFGKDFLIDDRLLFQLALTLRDARFVQLSQALDEKIVLAKPSLRQSLELLRNTEKTLPETLSELDELRVKYKQDLGGLTRIPLRALLQRCTAEECERPEVLKVGIDTAWTNGELSLARMRASKLVQAEPNDQHQFALAYMSLVDNDVAAASAALQQILSHGPESPWHEPALQLAALTQQERRFESQIDQLPMLLKELIAQGYEVSEGRFQFLLNSQVKITGYLGIDLEKHHWEFEVYRNGLPQILYKTTADDSRYFLNGDMVITSVDKQGLVPCGGLDLSQDSTGQFHFKFFPKFVLASEAKSSDLIKLLTQVADQSPNALTESMRRLIFASHSVAGGIKNLESGVEFSWITFEPFQTVCRTTRIIVNSQQGTLKLNTSDGTEVSLTLGKSQKQKLAPPPWPTLTEVTRPDHDPSFIFRTIALMVQMFQDHPEPKVLLGK